MKEATNKDEARQQAIEWQRDFSKRNMTWGEVVEWEAYFTDLANKYNLIEEFKENGII